MRQKILGFHPDTAVSLNNLGSLYIDREDFGKAEQHLRRALAIQVELLGEHPDAAVTLCNLASLYMTRSKLEIAQECATRALSIQMKSMGEHPLTAQTLYLVGGILAAKGETKGAEASAWQGIRMLEAIDPLHNDMPVFLRSYGYLLRRMGRSVEGENWDALAEERETEIARRIKIMD
jgi:tetratricopeptide (TPR) repeat protein